MADMMVERYLDRSAFLYCLLERNGGDQNTGWCFQGRIFLHLQEI